jgi:putative ABC transport system ATP-binding protein
LSDAPLVRVADLTKSYQLGTVSIPVLNGVGLEVRRGEMVAIMGPSGGGKSTLLGILGLLDRATTGTYQFAQHNVVDLDDDALSAFRNREIGFVFQAFHLLPLLNVLDNVCLPLTYRAQVSDDEMRARARELLDRVGLSQHVSKRPAELSGGQQQRVAIARALAGGPSLLLADEPTGALDTQTSGEIMRLFREVNRERGVTMIYVTHDLQSAACADRTVRVRDGRLVEHTA